jgi:phosphotransferase system HPr (HPr) family protein
MLTSCENTIRMPEGVALHARPAGLFVRTAAGFRSEITVTAGGRSANAKSILSVMALGARGGTALELRAEGEDAERALTALSNCVSGLVE